MTRILNQEEKQDKEKEMLTEIKKLITPQKNEALKDINVNEEDGEDYESGAKKFKRSKTVTLELPRKILKAPGICQMLERTKQSTGVANNINAGVGDLNDFDLSKITASTSRNASRK